MPAKAPKTGSIAGNASAMPKPRLERTRKSIVSAAADLFLAEGFPGTNMDKVAVRANVSKQTVYAHFGSKEALFLEVVRGMAGGASEEVEQEGGHFDEQPLERFLLDFANRQLSIVVTPRLMELRRLVVAESKRFPELGRLLHELGPARSIDWLARAFTRYKKRGQLKTSNVHRAASFFNWLVMGAPVNDAMLLGSSEAPSAGELRAHAEEAVRIFMAAYSDKPRDEG